MHWHHMSEKMSFVNVEREVWQLYNLSVFVIIETWIGYPKTKEVRMEAYKNGLYSPIKKLEVFPEEESLETRQHIIYTSSLKQMNLVTRNQNK